MKATAHRVATTFGTSPRKHCGETCRKIIKSALKEWHLSWGFERKGRVANLRRNGLVCISQLSCKRSWHAYDLRISFAAEDGPKYPWGVLCAFITIAPSHPKLPGEEILLFRDVLNCEIPIDPEARASLLLVMLRRRYDHEIEYWMNWDRLQAALTSEDFHAVSCGYVSSDAREYFALRQAGVENLDENIAET